MSAPAQASISSPKADKNTEAKEPSQYERGFLQLAQMRTEVLETPPLLLLKCYS